MIQFGLVESMFKRKLSGQPDCTVEGMTLWRATSRLVIKMRTDEANEYDFLNLVQMWINLSERCNYWATVEGVIVSR